MRLFDSAAALRPVRSLALAAAAALAAGCGSPANGADAATDAAVDAAIDAAADDAAVDAADAAADTGAFVFPRVEGYLDRYPLQARFPEGGAFDPTDRAFYVGSLDDGSVRRVDARTGAETVVFRETAPGRWWTLGMGVDVERRRLWVCAMDDRSPMPRAGRVWVFDLARGARVANHALADAGAGATCTDVAVTRAGRGYVVDRERGDIYQVDEAAGATRFVAGAPELRSDFVGQNAVLVLPDESALLSLIYRPAGLVRVGLADRSVRAVAIDGRFSEQTLVNGADGMAFANGSVYVAFTSQLVRVTPAGADWGRAAATTARTTSGLTDVIATPNGLYLLNGQAVRFAFGGAVDPFALVRFDGAL